MERSQVTELHYITPIRNIESILNRGILSNRLAAELPHESIAMTEIQHKREKKIVPGGRPLHDYVNLYFNARNTMMYKRRSQHAEICVLRVSADVLDLPDVIIADQNASSQYALFLSSPDGLRAITASDVFAESWVHPGDQIAQWRHCSAMCAEVLIPNKVGTRVVRGAYVSCSQAQKSCNDLAAGLSISLNAKIFFR